jgi:hypothetical protein
MSSPCRAPIRLQIRSRTRSLFHPLILTLASPSIRYQRRHRSIEEGLLLCRGNCYNCVN